MKLFITGGSGYVGNEFIKYCKKKVSIIYLVSRKKINIKDKRIKIFKGRVSRDWKTEMQNSDMLIHFAAAGVSNKKISYNQAYKFNVKESLKLFENAKKNELKKWIIIGSSSEYGSTSKKKINTKFKPRPKCNYSKTKYIFSKKIIEFSKKYRCSCAILRLFPVYGSNEPKHRLYPSLIRSIKSSKNFLLKNGNQLNDYSKIDNAVKKIYDYAKYMRRKKNVNQIWHIASGQSLLLRDFVKKIWTEHNSKAKLKIISQSDKNLIHHITNQKSIWKI